MTRNKAFWCLVVIFCTLSLCGIAYPDIPQPGQTSTVTLRLDSSSEPVDNDVVTFRAYASDRQMSKRLGRDLDQARHSGTQDFVLTEIPLGPVTVMLEGINAKGDVVAFFVKNLDLTVEPETVIVDFLTPSVESSEELGFGFRRVVILKPTDFEIGHFAYLYSGDQRLCSLGTFSVSPSGRYAIFQDDYRSGNLFLYRRADGRQTQLTTRFVALVSNFEWNEDEGWVQVTFVTGLFEKYYFQAQP